MRRLLAGAAIVVAFIVTSAGGASAHPLGNFSVNRYAGIVVGAHGVAVDYVVDYAELPTYQLRHRYDANGDGDASSAERAAFARATCPTLVDNLTLQAAGSARPLDAGASTATLHAGQG